MKRRFLLGIAGVVVAVLMALAVGGFFVTHERVEEEYDLGPDPELVANPFLAFEHYLEGLDVGVDIEPDPHDTTLLDEVDVLVLDSDFAAYGGFRRYVTGPWIEGGGHLILLSGHEDGEMHEDLEMELNLITHGEWERHLEVDSPWEKEGGDYSEVFYVYDEIEEEQIWEAKRAPRSTIWGWNPMSWTIIAHGHWSPDFIATTDEGLPLFISARHDQGRVSVVSEPRLLHNEGMEIDGAAQLWADLLSMDAEWPEEAMLFVHRQPEAWLDRVLRRGWPFFAGLVLWLIIGFTRARRFGPTIPEPERRRRRRGDHIRASGHFLWHHQGRDVLVDATRRALVDALKRRRPSIQTMKPSKRYAVMAEELQIDVEALRKLLEAPVPRRQGEYQTLVARLETLRRKL